MPLDNTQLSFLNSDDMDQQTEQLPEAHHSAFAQELPAAHDQPASIAALATKFVRNVKSRFGEQARETNVVFTALGRFNCGEISKRETLSTISDTLDSHYDLKRDLMNVLNHRAAQWAPEDFELPLIPVQQIVPKFLQPVHQPHMRMPPLFIPWETSSRRLSALGPPITEDLSHPHNFELDKQNLSLPPLESAFISPTFHNTIPVQLTSPDVDHIDNVSLYQPTFDVALPSVEDRDTSQESQFLEQWENVDYGTIWDGERLPHRLQHEQQLERTTEMPPAELLETHHLDNARLDRRSESVTAISPCQLQVALPAASMSNPNVLGEPFATTIGQPAVDMLPPPVKRSRKFSSVQPTVEEQYGKEGTQQRSEDFRNQRLIGSKASQTSSPARRKKCESGSRFVHSICGKSFTNRSKVKKHHWGNKIGDTNTTTGCWYKHGRPNVNWDEHPSCKEAPSRVAEAPPPVNSLRAKYTSVENKAPTVPTMVPGSRNILPSFPLAQHVSRPVRSPHAPSNYMDGGNIQYHTHGFPSTVSSSPFEKLLTVVNVAANIESPVPKGRNDSVVFSNLDAEAIAAERTGRYKPTWAFTSAEQASYFDPVFGQHQLRSSPVRPDVFDNAMEQEW